MKLLEKIILSLAAILVLSGCGTTVKFVYPSSYKELAVLSHAPKYNKSVAVLPFDDLRGDANSNKYPFGLLPLFPFGWANYERPDAAGNFNTIYGFDFTPTEDLAKAAVCSIKRSALFKNVYFSYGGDIENADLIFKGEIIATPYHGKILTYGISVFGSIFWLLGFPSDISTDEISVAFKLIDRKENMVVWEYSFTKHDTVVQGLYYNNGKDVKYYSKVMQDGMNEAVRDMDKCLQVAMLPKNK